MSFHFLFPLLVRQICLQASTTLSAPKRGERHRNSIWLKRCFSCAPAEHSRSEKFLDLTSVTDFARLCLQLLSFSIFRITESALRVRRINSCVYASRQRVIRNGFGVSEARGKSIEKHSRKIWRWLGIDNDQVGTLANRRRRERFATNSWKPAKLWIFREEVLGLMLHIFVNYSVKTFWCQYWLSCV